MMINESSGILAAFAIYDFLRDKKDLHYSYRFAFFPETIGSIVLKNRLDKSGSINNIVFSIVLTCLGYKSRNGIVHGNVNTGYISKLLESILEENVDDFKVYDYNSRGDERQYCWPNNQLDCSYLVSAKFGEYPEYHTNMDNYSVFSEENFTLQISMYKQFIARLENRRFPKATTMNEPMLSKLGLYGCY